MSAISLSAERGELCKGKSPFALLQYDERGWLSDPFLFLWYKSNLDQSHQFQQTSGGLLFLKV